MFGTAFGLCLSAVSVTPQDPPQEQVLLTYPLRELTGIRLLPSELPMWTVLGGAADSIFGLYDLLNPDSSRSEPLPYLQPNQILDLLGSLYADDLDERLSLELLNESTLAVRGAADASRRVVETLGRMESVLARPIGVEARLYEWEGREPPPAIVSSAELVEITRGIQPLWEGRSETRSFARVGLGQERLTPYVRSAGVEISVDSSVGIPELAMMFEGVRVNVEPHALIGSDDLVLMCEFAISQQKRPMALRDPGMPRIPTLDVPFVDMDTATMSGRIQSGGALLYCAQSPASEGSSVLLVVSAAHGRGPGSSPQGVRLLPVSALTTDALTNSPNLVYGRARRGIETWEGWLGEENRQGYGALDPDRLQSEVMTNIHPEAWGDRASMNHASGYFFLRGDPSVLDDVEELLIQLQNRWVRNTTIELVTNLEEAKSGLGPLSEGLGAARDEPLHRLVFPALVGRSHQSFHGVETTALVDIRAEVAEKSEGPYPVVDYVFGGTQTFVLPYAVEEGLGARIRLDLMHATEPERRSTNVEGGGDLYPSRLGVAYFTHHGPVGPGQYIDFGMGPTVTIDNRTYRTRQRVRVSLR